MPVNTAYLSDQTTDYTSDVSVNSLLSVSNFSVTGTSNLVGTVVFGGAQESASALSAGEATFTGGNFTSTITSTDGDFISVNTQTNSSGMTVGHLRVVFAASGVSLMYSSGESEYIVNSAVSLAQS